MRRIGNLLRRILRKILLPIVNDIRLNAYVVYGDESRLTMAAGAVVKNALFNTVSGTIRVEEGAFFGHNVCLLTGRHDVAKTGQERQSAVPQTGCDIAIGKGAWLSSNVTVIGPCVIGENAVVCAGAVVTHDVAPDTMVAGVPAVPVKRMSNDE